MKPIYILSSACLSPQDTFEKEYLGEELTLSKDNMLQCTDVNYAAYINPVQIRRMSRVLKMGFATAMQCMNNAPNIVPDAIIVGTGKGSLTDTEQFLEDIKTYKETALNAMPFIQSTYNQLNGMIALNKKIDSYNITYVHRGFSLEHAIIDAMLFAEENNGMQHILVGCYDEMTRDHFYIKKQWGYWKEEITSNDKLLDSTTSGTISGEGASFFLLSSQAPALATISIAFVSTLYKPSSLDIEVAYQHLLDHLKIRTEDIDVLMLGESGDFNHFLSYKLVKDMLPNAVKLYFKHLSGEYDTAIQIGVWLANSILKSQQIPKQCFGNDSITSIDKKIKYVLIYNNYFSINHSFIVLQREY